MKEFRITVDWSKLDSQLKTTPTLQVVVNPKLRRGSPLHDPAFMALRNLAADYVRFVPWVPFPKLAVAELEPPRDAKTSWDFSLIDPLVLDFLEATKGHPVILNFSTQPAWMFVNANPISYPSNPDEVTWSYSFTPDKGLVDPTARQLADYYGRVVSWYTQGGFTDECGHYHKSDHHFQIPYWEVLNEPDAEHAPSVQQYTVWYDAIVEAIREVSPSTKFVGLALGPLALNSAWFEYFLDPQNHRPGIPLDMISYHFYAIPGPTESIEQWQYSFFSQADEFVSKVRFIELIRNRLSPSTRTTINEVGSFLPTVAHRATPEAIPATYWNLSGATYAYLFMKLSALGIDSLAQSALLQYPTLFPDVTMIDWTNGKPNARYWILKLLKAQLENGDQLCATSVESPADEILLVAPEFAAQGYKSPQGKRKVLLINKRNRDIQIALGPEAKAGQLDVVDETSAEGPARTTSLDSETIALGPFAVAIVSLQ
jgi:hypothetical protein